MSRRRHNPKQAKKICSIIVEENMQGIDSLLVRGIKVKSNAEICSNYLNALGVPGEAITILPGKAKSTREEAEIISKYLSGQPEIKSLNIVSSPFHTKRAFLIFRKALKNQDVKVQIKTSPSDRYYEMHDKPWWSGKEGIQAVATEYIKLYSFILIEQFCIEYGIKNSPAGGCKSSTIIAEIP